MVRKPGHKVRPRFILGISIGSLVVVLLAVIFAPQINGLWNDARARFFTTSTQPSGQVTSTEQQKTQPPGFTPPVFVTNLSTETVLFVHGIGENDTIPGGCNGATNWGPAETYLQQHDWKGKLVSVGYYSSDTDCDVSLQQESKRCKSYYDSGSADGTWNEDIRHIACELAWYIWSNYTEHGLSIEIAAHSMGGIITRWALFAASFDKVFPPFLLVNHVVTMGTPHGGVPPMFATRYCNGCLQATEMASDQPFMQELLHGSTDNGAFHPGDNPQARGGTAWTMMASDCDVAELASSDDGVFMSLGYKVIFTHANKLYPQGTCYQHGDYLLDQSDASDASIHYCNGCSLPPDQYTSTSQAPHSLRIMYNALLGEAGN